LRRVALLEDPQLEALKQKQAPPPKLRVRLGWDASVVIRSDRPASLRRYTNGTPTPFQDDLSAIADHGSLLRLRLPDDLREV
jgi:hypothetical protein